MNKLLFTHFAESAKFAPGNLPLSEALCTMSIREFIAKNQPGINKLQQEFMVEFFPEFADDPKQYEWNADFTMLTNTI